MRYAKFNATLLIVSMAALVGRAAAQDRTRTNDPSSGHDGTKVTRTETTTTTTITHDWSKPASRWQKASDVMGKNVETPTGQGVGDVDDLIVDMGSGRVIYFIISCGVGRQCAVPAGGIQLPADAKKFIIPQNKDQLKAYSFEKGRFPDFTDRSWASQNFSHYNVQAYWDIATPTGATAAIHVQFPSQWMKASDIVGKDVRNAQNENLGKIEDLAVDPDNGRVIYGVLSFGGFLGLGDKLFALPFSSLTNLSADRHHFVLSIEKDRLKTAQGFDKKNWPNLADTRWATDVSTFYGQPVYWQSGSSDYNRTRSDTNRTGSDVNRPEQDRGRIEPDKNQNRDFDRNPSRDLDRNPNNPNNPIDPNNPDKKPDSNNP